MDKCIYFIKAALIRVYKMDWREGRLVEIGDVRQEAIALAWKRGFKFMTEIALEIKRTS